MADIKYYDVLLKPVVTEKSMNLMADKKYTFLVAPEATKIQIREAVRRRKGQGSPHDESCGQEQKKRHDRWQDCQDEEGHCDVDRGQQGYRIL